MEYDLVRRAQAGDHEAFSSLAQLSVRRLFAVASRILGDTHLAEDAVQDALVEVWQDLRGLRDPQAFGAWSMRILVRVAHRQARRSPRPAQLSVEAIGVAGPDEYAAVADQDLLERGFRRLSVEQRTILVLRHHLGLEPAEIAEVLGIPQGTARSRLHYAREAMRAALAADARRDATQREAVR